ncbi:MAG: GPR endopeptidase [Clostridia bacterium]|nr:GPR endopeptidase [Clostridia bacterium]
MFSDLAVDFCSKKSSSSGVLVSERQWGRITERKVEVLSKQAEKEFGKPVGKYVSLEIPHGFLPQIPLILRLKELLFEFIVNPLPKGANVLVVGFGNGNLSCDALGSLVMDGLIVCPNSRVRVCTLKPGVEGVTGLQAARVLKAVVREIKPNAVVCVDALVGAEFSRIGSVFQVTDTGLTPGSGTGNRAFAVTRESLGIPVYAIGVPLAVPHEIAGEAARKYLVCPREIDLLVRRVSRVISDAVNLAFHPELSLSDLRTCLN